MSSSVSTLYVNGNAASGLLGPGDYDYFLVSLIAGATYTISLNAANSDGLSDPFLYLVGAYTDDYLVDDDSGGSQVANSPIVGASAAEAPTNREAPFRYCVLLADTR